jgi:hypothetical protein
MKKEEEIEILEIKHKQALELINANVAAEKEIIVFRQQLENQTIQQQRYMPQPSYAATWPPQTVPEQPQTNTDVSQQKYGGVKK